jgi:hypothetical protein
MVCLGSVLEEYEKRAPAIQTAAETGLAYCRWLGVAGSAVVVAGGVLAGVAPIDDSVIDLPWVLDLRSSAVLSVLVVYLGLTVLLIAWWRLGAMVSRSDGPSWRWLVTTTAWWSVPFAFTTPIFSGDAYSYLAQGAMTMSGLDVYRMGPAALGGPLAANVPDIWQNAPAPYGPVFLDLAGTVTNLTKNNVWAGIIGMRVLALVGLGMLLWSVPRLASYCGVRPEAATWLAVLNPLVLLHLLGDVHNEALMLGLMCLGLTLVAQRRPALGVALITLAGLVKAPAGLAVAFVIPMVAGQLTGNHRGLRAAYRAGGVASVTALVVTALAGTGFGWIRTLDTPTHARTWMSITTDLGFAAGTLGHQISGQSVDQVRHVFWAGGLIIAAGLGVILWRRSVQLGTVTALGLCLAVFVLAGPVVHPWYLLWGIVPLAIGSSSEVIRRMVAVGSVALVLLVLPGSVQPDVRALVGALLGTSAVLVLMVMLARFDRRRLGVPMLTRTGGADAADPGDPNGWLPLQPRRNPAGEST